MTSSRISFSPVLVSASRGATVILCQAGRLTLLAHGSIFSTSIRRHVTLLGLDWVNVPSPAAHCGLENMAQSLGRLESCARPKN